MTCLIPVLLTILALDPCAVLRDAQVGWNKAEWFRSIYQGFDGQQYVPRALDELPKQLILREELEPWPSTFDPSQVVLANVAVYQDYFQIRFARGYMHLMDAWTHEIRHINCRSFTPQEACIVIGHGRFNDPLFQAGKIWFEWSYPYPEGHPYLPTLIPSGIRTITTENYEELLYEAPK